MLSVYRRKLDLQVFASVAKLSIVLFKTSIFAGKAVISLANRHPKFCTSTSTLVSFNKSKVESTLYLLWLFLKKSTNVHPLLSSLPATSIHKVQLEWVDAALLKRRSPICSIIKGWVKLCRWSRFWVYSSPKTAK